MYSLILKILSFVLILKCSYSQYPSYFFNDTLWDNSTITQDLGVDPYSCLGNIGMCLKGFTIGFWLKVDSSSSDRYVLSSGGQSFISEGFYVRKSHEIEFEVGVSKEDKLWMTKMYIYEQHWFYLSFVWSPSNGLRVVLDGNLIRQVKLPQTRKFVRMTFDPFPKVTVGRSNEVADIAGKLNFSLKQIVFIDKEIDLNEEYSYFERNRDQLVIHCSSTRPLRARDSGPPSSTSNIKICQNVCSSKFYNGLMFKNNVSCECLTATDILALNYVSSETSCPTSDYMLAWASHEIFNDMKSLNLSVEMKPSKSSYNVTENVIFHIGIQPSDKVYFVIDFGDGVILKTEEIIIGHFWDKEGKYVVNITAVNYFVSISSSISLDIINNHTGVPPENLNFKSEMSSEKPYQVALFVSTFSNLAKNCTVKLSEDVVIPLTDELQFVLSKNYSYTFSKNGFYNSSFICNNLYGTSSMKYEISAFNQSMGFQRITSFFNHPLVFYVLNGKNKIETYLNNKVSDSLIKFINGTHVIIGADDIRASGDHIVSMKSIYKEPILSSFYRVLTPLGNISMMGKSFSAQIGESLFFDIEMSQGDQVNMIFDCGNGKSQILFYPYLTNVMSVKVNCSYDKLRSYNLSVYAANEVSEIFYTRHVSIQKLLSSCQWTASNTSDLGIPTLFSFLIDEGNVPPTSVYLGINYGDGVSDNVTMVSENLTSSIFKHYRVYPKYGIFKVSATVFNNLSSISLNPQVIQVGENITSLDLFIKETVLTVNQQVIITAKCPTGAPVLLEIDMGDGTILKKSRPVDYVNNPLLYSLSNLSLVSGINLRSDIELTYQYKSAGTFKVSALVSNMFSSTNTGLCPSVMIVNGNEGITCSVNSVLIENLTDISKPLINMRSVALKQATISQLICAKSSETYKPLYTWTVEKLIGGSLWKPELRVCETGLLTNLLTINPNTLWYGTYRLNVSQVVGVVKNDKVVATSLHTNVQSSTFIKVNSTPLIAIISSDKNNFYSINDVVNLNLSQSRDPDVTYSNKTGMTFSVFCSYSSVYDALPLSEMMKRVSVVVKNDAIHGILYQFKAKPCFSSIATVMFTKALEIVFLARDALVTDSLRFSLFLSKDERSSNSSVQFSILATDLSASPLDSIDDLLAKGDTNAALQILDLVTNGLSQKNESEGAQTERTQVRGRIITCLNKVTDNLADIGQLSKTTKVMSDVTANPEEVTAGAKSDAAKGLNNAADKALTLTKDASVDDVHDITKTMLSTVGQILPFAPSNQTNSSDIETPKRTKRSILSKKVKNTKNHTELSCCEKLNGLCLWIESIPNENETSIVDVVDLKTYNWTEEECDHIYPCDLIRIQNRYNQYLKKIKDAENAVKQATTTNGLGAITTVGGILVSKQTPGKTSGIESPGMNLTVANLASDSSDSPNGFGIPKSVGGCGAVALESGNPFTYGDDNEGVSGNVKTLLLTSCDGKPIKVENSTEPFTLWLDGSPEEAAYDDFLLEHVVNQNSMSYHKIDMQSNGTALFSNIIPDEAFTFDVYIKYLSFPNASFYDWKTVIPNPNITGDKRYLFFPPQEITKLNGTYRIGVALHINDSTREISKNISYSMQTYLSSCKYWNENTTSWDTSGCTVGTETTSIKTECKCNHLTSFGGSFAVPVNTIDFNTVFTTEKFLESIPVFCTIIALLVVYVLALVWARHMDKADVAKWGALPLEDNIPTETYYYQITVHTGMKKNAGTTSIPSFILSGDEADTGVRILTDGKRKEIVTGSINNYILAVDKCLGPLTFLRIWHDNSGKGSKKGWYLDQMEIIDVQTGERFFFVCSQWMAVEEGDGMIERVIPVAGKEDMTQFGQLFSHSVRKKFSNDHLWISVFSRPTRSSFTRVQRISCCVSLLFMTMIVNCMFFKSADPDHTTSVHIGPIEITLQQIYISVVSTCIILPPSVIIITIFRYTKPKRNTVQQLNLKTSSKGWQAVEKDSIFWSKTGKTKKQKLTDAIHNIATFHRRMKYKSKHNKDANKKKGFSFPWWTIYIAWALVFISIVASGFFTILYSMQWGREKSLDWLKTFFLSFFQSVIVVQPVKVLLLAAFIACILKKPDIEEEDGIDSNILNTDEDFTEIQKKNIKEILKKRNRAIQSTGVIDMTKLKSTRETRLKEIQIEAILKECTVYIFFILVLYFISYQDKDKRSFTFVQHLQNQFFESGKPKFSEISSFDDFYGWVNDTLMSQLYTEGWYNGQTTKNWMESMQTRDHVTIRLGVARIRQLRIKENTCSIQKNFKVLIKHCRADYNWLDDDTGSYRTSWNGKLRQEEAKKAKQYDLDKHNPWLYRDSLDLKSAPYMGHVNTYKGGGYTFNFYCNPQKTIMKLGELKDDNWLDVRTRAIIVEFTVYNVNANLFGSVIMLLEFLSTGAPIVTQEVKVFKISSYVGPFGIIVIIFQVIFVAFVIYFMIRTINLLRKQKKEYFKSFWNILELLTMIMSIVTIAMYAMKMIFGNTAMNVLKETGAGDYVNFITIGLWAEIYGIVLAIVVFLATIKFINMLKFNKRLSMLSETIKFSIKDMRAFSITFFIYFLAFAQFGYLLFSTKLDSYSNFANVIETLFQFFIGKFTFSDYSEAQPVMGPIYFFLFVWVVCFGMQTMFLVIIIEAFQAVRKENQFKKNDYEVAEYIIDKFKGFIGRN